MTLSKKLEKIQYEAQVKSKTKHFLDTRREQEVRRPYYVTKFSRKQCNAIAIARAKTRMSVAKANHKNQYVEHLQRRYCNKEEKRQMPLLNKDTSLYPKERR